MKTTQKQTTNQNLAKRVMIFDIVFSLITDQGLLPTQELHRKLELLMKKKGQNITIETYNSNKIKQYAEEADLILLTPSFAYAKEEIEENFPKVPVIAISKKEYGLLDSEKLYDEIIKALGME
ncbi:hypothetical protein [Enterococcus sp. UD-01]|uniref:hypothetical protein n=1 Tax=Enterococcus sp. UD-01 TaxID=3373911 RepID=UPI0038344423